MSKYIEDLQGGKIIHDRKEDVELSKLDGHQIFSLKLAKYIITGVVAIILSWQAWRYTYSIVDRIEIGHGIKVIATQETVTYPPTIEKKSIPTGKETTWFCSSTTALCEEKK